MPRATHLRDVEAPQGRSARGYHRSVRRLRVVLPLLTLAFGLTLVGAPVALADVAPDSDSGDSEPPKDDGCSIAGGASALTLVVVGAAFARRRQD